MYKSIFKRFLSLIVFFGLTSQALAAPSYDFFKDSSVRIDEANELLRKTPSDVAQIVLFLETLRDSYYTHLDRIESALPYWEWAKHHPYRYTASQLPNKWFTHEKNQAEITRIHTMVNAVREVYSKEFGIIVRLLAARCEDALDDAAWFAEVQKGVATLLSTPLKELSTAELIIQKLADHEHEVAQMVEKVQKPGWLMRNWRLLLTTAVVAGAATYYYAHNQDFIHTSAFNLIEASKNSWENNFVKPVSEFKNELEAASRLTSHKTQVIDNGEAYLDELKKEIEKTTFTYRLLGGQKGIDAIFKYACSRNARLNDVANRGDEALQSSSISIKLFQLMFPVAVTAIGYTLSRAVFNWFTTRDRSVLVSRLRQVQQVLIRTTHAVELSDAEYGRMLYLLMKAYDQVAKNVFSNERIAFLNDLSYIADAQSSVKQKRKTLKTMWHSYRSLRQAA